MADWIDEVNFNEQFQRNVALSKDEVAALRARTVAQEGAPEGGFTCDTCWGKNICRLAFDWYNTNGDCLYEK